MSILTKIIEYFSTPAIRRENSISVLMDEAEIDDKPVKWHVQIRVTAPIEQWRDKQVSQDIKTFVHGLTGHGVEPVIGYDPIPFQSIEGEGPGGELWDYLTTGELSAELGRPAKKKKPW